MSPPCPLLCPPCPRHEGPGKLFLGPFPLCLKVGSQKGFLKVKSSQIPRVPPPFVSPPFPPCEPKHPLGVLVLRIGVNVVCVVLIPSNVCKYTPSFSIPPCRRHQPELLSPAACWVEPLELLNLAPPCGLFALTMHFL